MTATVTVLDTERHKASERLRQYAKSCYREAESLREHAQALDDEGVEAEAQAYRLEPW